MADPILIPDATTEPAAYVAALLRTLGDRDPLEVYEHTAQEVRRQCQDLDHERWTTPMADGEWSALQVVGHLFDVDVVYGFRWRLALTRTPPPTPATTKRHGHSSPVPRRRGCSTPWPGSASPTPPCCAASMSATCADAASTANRAARTSNA
jgi:hypothetical protein